MTSLNRLTGRAYQLAFSLMNPIKKKVISTHCQVHKFINIQSLIVLKNDEKFKEFNFFKNYIEVINEGTVWADQDFKSSNHFYNPYTRKGLYGRDNAMDLFADYYKKSIKKLNKGKTEEAMFYFGAASHLIQDVTIPQHANIRLLDNHRQYENFVIRTYKDVQEYRAEMGAYKFKSVENYMKFNARVAMKVHKQFCYIKEDQLRFDKISRCILPLAERTTAGFMLTYFDKILN